MSSVLLVEQRISDRKVLGSSLTKVESAFYPSEVDKILGKGVEKYKGEEWHTPLPFGSHNHMSVW